MVLELMTVGAAKFFYQENTLISVVAGERGSRYVRTKDAILCERSDGISPASLLACELSGTVNVAASSNKLWGFTYTPYGRRFETSLQATRLSFNGEYLLSWVEIYLLGGGYRAYSPCTMRFISPDSISPFHVLNAYSYCGSDPVNNADPSGHIRESHLLKFKARFTVVKKSMAEMVAYAETVQKLSSKTRLKDAEVLMSNAKQGIQRAYVHAAPARDWLVGKVGNPKYADKVNAIEQVLDGSDKYYRKLQEALDSAFAVSQARWALNESALEREALAAKEAVNHSEALDDLKRIRS